MSDVTFFMFFCLCLGILVGFLIANLVIEIATRKNKKENNNHKENMYQLKAE